MSELKLLQAGVRTLITPAFLSDNSGIDVSKHLRDYHRAVDLEPLSRVIAEAMNQFQGGRPELSDGWLASRVHATSRPVKTARAIRPAP